MSPTSPHDLRALHRARLADMVRAGGAAGLQQTAARGDLAVDDVPARSSRLGYLGIDDIPGESRRSRHEGEIELVAWTFGVEADEADRRGRRAATPYAGFVAPRSIASPPLWHAASTGARLREVTLSVVDVVGGTAVDVLEVVFRQAVLTSYRAVLDPDTGSPWDVLSLEYAAMEFTTVEIADDHSVGGEISYEVDFARDT